MVERDFFNHDFFNHDFLRLKLIVFEGRGGTFLRSWVDFKDQARGLTF